MRCPKTRRRQVVGDWTGPPICVGEGELVLGARPETPPTRGGVWRDESLLGAGSLRSPSTPAPSAQ